MQPKDHIIKKLLCDNEIAGAIVSSPENFHYVCGFAAHQHTVSRQPSFAAAILSSSGSEPSFVITMDFEAPAFEERNSRFKIRAYDTWVGVKKLGEITGELQACNKPVLATHFDVLAQTVQDLGLSAGVIGLELDYLPVAYYQKLQELFPEAAFVNISNLFIYARSVKTAEEIEMFRLLCRTADKAFLEVSKMAKAGVSEREMSRCFRNGVFSSGVCVPSAWSMFAIGPNCSRLALPDDRRAVDGDVIKFDAGVNAEFDFYTTDTSRSWIIGNAAPEIHRLKDRLYEAQRRMIAAAKPGLPINELFRIGYNYVAEKFPCYRRGHLGHSISMGPSTAEAPFINAAETRPLEPGMVLAVEVPCYIEGVNGFNIEDMILITKYGCDVLTPQTPHYL